MSLDDRLERGFENATTSPSKAIWTVVKILILVAVISIPLMLVTGVIGFGSDVAGEVFDAKKVVYTYEQFHRDYTGIKAQDVIYQTNKDTHDAFLLSIGTDRKQYASADRDMLNMYVQSMVGVKSERNRMAASYNAKSAMITRDIFKGTSLPKRIVMIP